MSRKSGPEKVVREIKRKTCPPPRLFHPSGKSMKGAAPFLELSKATLPVLSYKKFAERLTRVAERDG